MGLNEVGADGFESKNGAWGEGESPETALDDGDESPWNELAYGPAFDPEKGVVFPQKTSASEAITSLQTANFTESIREREGVSEREEPILATRVVPPETQNLAFGEVDLASDQTAVPLEVAEEKMGDEVEATVSMFGNMSVTATPEVIRTTIGPGEGERFVVQRHFPWKTILILLTLSFLGFFILPHVGIQVPDPLGVRRYAGTSNKKVALSKASAPNVGDFGKKVVDGVKDASRSVAQTAEQVWEGGVDGVIEDVVSVATGSKNAVVLIESTPSGAEVLVGKKSLGVTPFAGNNIVPAGKTQAAHLRKKGYRDAVIQLEGGKDVTAKVILKRLSTSGDTTKAASDKGKESSSEAKP